jgi:hypothetical protein
MAANMSKPRSTDKYPLNSSTTTTSTTPTPICTNTTSTKMQFKPLADIIANASLIDGPTDLAIVCRDGRRFEIHKFFVCPRPKVLARMCEIDMREKHTGVIKHNEFDSDTVALMLQHAYTGEYEVTKRPVPLSFLESESAQEDKEQVAREAEKEKAKKQEAVGKSADESGNGIGLNEGVGSGPVAAAAVAAVAADHDEVADDGTLQPLLSDTLNTLSHHTQNTDSAQSGEKIRKRQQFGTAYIPNFNASFPLGIPWPGIIDQLVTHARVNGLADYYEMQTLREYSCRRFSQIVNQRGVDLRPGHTLPFIDVVKEVGARTDKPSDPLRMTFLKLIMEHATDLCCHPGFVKELGDSGLSGLAADMLHEVALSLVRDRLFYVEQRKKLRAIHTSMTDKEESWEDCAPGWQYQ